MEEKLAIVQDQTTQLPGLDDDNLQLTKSNAPHRACCHERTNLTSKFNVFFPKQTLTR